ncbi:hypothetical protein [Paraburkholderia sp. GAS82]|uniref:hypothetical protein n=1 Tax=Paraburkholderia sp. GAS82 TaxID=3035137 RepID=UPI003D1EC521
MQLPFKKDRALSPYLSDPHRLADVIAAIQAMATYGYYKLTFEGWADRISADVSQAAKWQKVFLDHPEFFRLDSARERASLVWRRQFPKRYDTRAGREVSREDFDAMDAAQRERVSRVPLEASDIKMLVDTAVNLHSRALEHQKDKRWWIPLASAAGGLIGSIIGAVVRHLFS